MSVSLSSIMTAAIRIKGQYTIGQKCRSTTLWTSYCQALELSHVKFYPGGLRGEETDGGAIKARGSGVDLRPISAGQPGGEEDDLERICACLRLTPQVRHWAAQPAFTQTAPETDSAEPRSMGTPALRPWPSCGRHSAICAQRP